VCDALDWRQQAETYVSVFRDLLGSPPPVPRPRSAASAVGARDDRSGRDELGRAYVDLEDPEELASFVRDRGRRRNDAVVIAEAPTEVPAPVAIVQPAPEIVASTAS
jgi:hypothetical protein